MSPRGADYTTVPRDRRVMSVDYTTIPRDHRVMSTPRAGLHDGPGEPSCNVPPKGRITQQFPETGVACVVPTCHEDGFKWFGPWFELDRIGCPNHSMLSGLVHDFSWIGLAAPITSWLRITVSNLPAILDARL
ncbi:hypothetical protein TIFTF001_014280 [Ficus carica]|uniref:Uncharacterized protein n=1 Tax=Ficus carica TaxID=3494 RepID=A0AA88AR40_FICCA|nr:hypothetical protein TIFTF001_014280 [Ficus carica]